MPRNQISPEEREYNLAKIQAKAMGISLAEFIRRAVRAQLPTPSKSAWMKYAGFVETGDPDSSRSIDEVVLARRAGNVFTK